MSKTSLLPPLHPQSPDQRTRFGLLEFDQAFPRESDLVERKAGIGVKPIQEVMVAMSNTFGGVILFGVRDNGELLGRSLTADTDREIHEAANTARSVGVYQVHEITVGNTAVVVVSIGAKLAGAAQTSDGRVLVRRGARNVSLFGEELLAFLQSRSRERFENTSTGLPLDRADRERVARLRGSYGWAREEVADRLIERGLVRREEGDLTVAGVLLLCDPLPDRFTKAVVELRRYQDDGTNYDRRLVFSGPVDAQIAHATHEVMNELGRELIVSGVYRYEVPRLPEVVVREALANAVAHREYEVTSTPIVVEVRPALVRVMSPGGLPEGVTEANIRTAQAARNVSLIAVLRHLGLAEDAGRGVDEIQDRMAEALLDSPRFRDEGSRVVVELPLRARVSRRERAWLLDLEQRGDLEVSDKLVLVRAARGEMLTNARVRDLLGLDSRDARALLRRLRDAGIVRQEGERGGASYVLESDFAPQRRVA